MNILTDLLYPVRQGFNLPEEAIMGAHGANTNNHADAGEVKRAADMWLRFTSVMKWSVGVTTGVLVLLAWTVL